MKTLMDRAKLLALELPNLRGFQRVACIITDKRGRILATGVNDYNCTHPLQKRLSEATGFDFDLDNWQKRFDSLPAWCKNDYTVTDEALAINRQRIAKRIASKPHYYRHRGKPL